MSRSVLITGGGSGIGAAAAVRLAQEGWEVCVLGRRTERVAAVAEAVGGFGVTADVRRPGDVQDAVTACVERFGRLDALVICAGAGASGAVLDQTLERFNTVLGTNLTGAFLTARAALPHLMESAGAIVTVASLAGLRADPQSAAYCASKAGLIMLTQCLALDYGPAGVRANCVCPGWIKTEMADAAMDELAATRGTDRRGAYTLAVAEVPAGRAGRPEEAAAAIAWLASADASYVNGAVLTVDGGAAVVDAGTLAFAPQARPAPATPPVPVTGRPGEVT